MTDIEQKALALLNEVLAERPFGPNDNYIYVTLCRAIEQHEAFRQEVSDAVAKLGCWPDTVDLGRFIISKPDLLIEVFRDVDKGCPVTEQEYADQFCAAIEKRGGKIVWGEG